MFKFKYMNNIYAEAANAVSSAESSVSSWQSEGNFATSLLADLQGEKGEKIADRRRLAMMADGVCDHHDEVGRAVCMSASDLLREGMAEIYRLEKKLAAATDMLAEKQAELERVRLFLAEEEVSICVPVVEEEDDDLDF